MSTNLFIPSPCSLLLAVTPASNYLVSRSSLLSTPRRSSAEPHPFSLLSTPRRYSGEHRSSQLFTSRRYSGEPCASPSAISSAMAFIARNRYRWLSWGISLALLVTLAFISSRSSISWLGSTSSSFPAAQASK